MIKVKVTVEELVRLIDSLEDGELLHSKDRILEGEPIEKEMWYSLPPNEEHKRKTIIDIEKKIGVILRYEKGGVIVAPYYKNKQLIEEIELPPNSPADALIDRVAGKLNEVIKYINAKEKNN